MVFVVLMLNKVGSAVDGLVSSKVVVSPTDFVEIVVSSPIEEVLVDEWSMKNDVESVSLVEVLVVVGEESLKVKYAVFNVVLVLNVVEVREVNFECSSVEKKELIIVVVSSFWVVKVSIVLGLFVVVVIEVEYFVVKEEGSFELLEENDSEIMLVVSVLMVIVVVVDG